MEGEEVKRVRDKLGLTRDELAHFLCLSGYQSMMNIETNFRKPSKLTVCLLRYLDSISKKRAMEFLEEFTTHAKI